MEQYSCCGEYVRITRVYRVERPSPEETWPVISYPRRRRVLGKDQARRPGLFCARLATLGFGLCYL